MSEKKAVPSIPFRPKYDTVAGMEDYINELRNEKTRLIEEQKFLMRVLDYLTGNGQ